jgi:hypothetical protein
MNEIKFDDFVDGDAEDDEAFRRSSIMSEEPVPKPVLSGQTTRFYSCDESEAEAAAQAVSSVELEIDLNIVIDLLSSSTSFVGAIGDMNSLQTLLKTKSKSSINLKQSPKDPLMSFEGEEPLGIESLDVKVTAVDITYVQSNSPSLTPTLPHNSTFQSLVEFSNMKSSRQTARLNELMSSLSIDSADE